MILEPCFGVYEDKLGRMASYLDIVAPTVLGRPASVPIFVESTVVLTAAYLEDFLTSLIGSATRERERSVRDYFSHSNNDHDRRLAESCDIPTLAALAKRRVSFKNAGAMLDAVFRVLFDCSPWPTAETREVVLDLVRVRQVILHQGSADLGGYASQMSRSDLFRVNSYDDLKVFHLDHAAVWLMLRDALIAMESQVRYLKAKLLVGQR